MGKPFDRRTPPPLPWEQTSGFPGFSSGTLSPAGGGWIPMSSSNVDGIMWDAESQYPLLVRFKSQGGAMAVYGYAVSHDMYDAMFSSSSPGRFVRYALAGHPYRRLE